MKKCAAKLYEGKLKYIFVSYCHKDYRFVFPIIEQLCKDGYRVWYDDGIEPGTEWPEIIASHLKNSAACIAFISNNSLNSHNCRHEVNYSFFIKKPFISVILEEVELSPGMELQLASTQSIFKYTISTQDEFFNKLYQAKFLKDCLGTPDSTIIVSDPRSYLDDDSNKKQYMFSDDWFSKRDKYETDEENTDSETVTEFWIIRNKTSEKRLIDKALFVIGRLSSCDYIIKDNDEISRSHAVISVDNSQVTIQDNNSTNKTYLNKQELTPKKKYVLKDGDIILLSDEMFTFHLEVRTIRKEYKEKTAVTIYLIRKNTDEKIEITKDGFKVGRSDKQSDFVITGNDEISRCHVVFRLSNEKVAVIDNDSLNKTYLNGKELVPFTEYVIHDGDLLQMSEEIFIFHNK